MKKLYFAHPINMYGTDLERELLLLLKKEFPRHEIVNPSDQVHLDKVTELRKNDPKVNVMPYFIGLSDACDDVAAAPFGDGMYGAGVWAEADKIQGNGGLAFSIHPVSRKINVVPKMLETQKLSVEETRDRIRNPDGTTKPYA